MKAVDVWRPVEAERTVHHRLAGRVPPQIESSTPVLVLDFGTGAEHHAREREVTGALERYRRDEEFVVATGYYFTREARRALEAAGCSVLTISDSAGSETSGS